MKKKSQRLRPVVRVAENREQQAVRALGESQTAMNLAKQKLAELENYRQDYLQNFQESGKAGMSAARMEDYRRFLQKLDAAIEQQKQVLAQAGYVVEQRRQDWFATRNKVRSLDNVVTRYEAEEQRQAHKKEQGDNDERSQRKSAKD
jgi:flagellar FliJ protein